VTVSVGSGGGFGSGGKTASARIGFHASNPWQSWHVSGKCPT